MNSNWFEFVGLVTGTKVWSLPLDLEAKMTGSHDGTSPCTKVYKTLPPVRTKREPIFHLANFLV